MSSVTVSVSLSYVVGVSSRSSPKLRPLLLGHGRSTALSLYFSLSDRRRRVVVVFFVFSFFFFVFVVFFVVVFFVFSFSFFILSFFFFIFAVFFVVVVLYNGFVGPQHVNDAELIVSQCEHQWSPAIWSHVLPKNRIGEVGEMQVHTSSRESKASGTPLPLRCHTLVMRRLFSKRVQTERESRSSTYVH